jgi:hypothetical protein
MVTHGLGTDRDSTRRRDEMERSSSEKVQQEQAEKEKQEKEESRKRSKEADELAKARESAIPRQLISQYGGAEGEQPPPQEQTGPRGDVTPAQSDGEMAEEDYVADEIEGMDEGDEGDGGDESPPPNDLQGEEDTTIASLMTFAIEKHVETRCLQRLPAFKLLDERTKNAFANSCEASAPFIKAQLDEYEATGSEQALLRAVKCYFSLPAVLVTLTKLRPSAANFSLKLPGVPAIRIDRRSEEEKAEEDDTEYVAYEQEASEEQAAAAAVKGAGMALRAGKTGLANRRLVSNGVAPPTEENANKARDMHKRRIGDIHPRTTQVQQVAIPTTVFIKTLKDKAGSVSTSVDPFGWSNDFLLYNRQPRGNEEDSFVGQVARMHSIFVTGEIPKAVALLLTIGKSTPLFKDPPHVRAARESAGDSMRIRPAVSGTNVMRVVLQEVNKTEAGKRVLKKLSKFNKALGTPAGIEEVIYESRAQYASGAAIGTNDMTNCFNEFDRNALLAAVEDEWPETLNLWQMVYGLDSPIFIHYADKDGLDHFIIVLSESGSRMGCVWGSIALGLAIDCNVYRPLDTEFPDMQALAICDDNIGFLVPEGGDWQKAFKAYGIWVRKYEELAATIGLSLNYSKGFLLLPPGAPLPRFEANLPASLTVTRAGVMVGGAPIGTEDYMDKAAGAVFGALQHRLRALELLKEHGEDQMAWILLGTCILTAITHFLRTTPAEITVPHAQRFDLAADRMREILAGGIDGMCGRERVTRMHDLAGLPTREGGLGHMRAALIAPLAYLAGVAAASNLPQFAKKREGMRKSIIWAHERGTAVLGGPTVVAARRVESPEFEEAFPAQAKDLYSNMRVLEAAADDNNSKNPASGRQAILSKMLVKQLAKRFQEAINPIKATDVQGSTLTSSDVGNACTNVDNKLAQRPNRLFKVLMYRGTTRMRGNLFVGKVRQFFGLPRLVARGERFQLATRSDVKLSSCTHHSCVRVLASGVGKEHRVELDPYGAHATACHKGAMKKSRVTTHNGLQRVIDRYGAKADAHPRMEPTATELMRGRYTAADCRALFLSSRVAKADKVAQSAELLVEIDDALDRPEGGERVEALAVVRRKLTQHAEDVFNTARAQGRPVDKYGAGVRPDIALGQGGADETPLETWIDVVGTNTLSHSYATPLFIQFQKLKAHEVDPRGDGPNRVPKSLRICESMKRGKYSPLLAAAQKHLAGETEVQFLTFGFSMQGTLSPEAERVIKCLKEAYGRKLERDADPRDGASLKHRMAVFEKDFRDEIAVTIARGVGEAQMLAGRQDAQGERRSQRRGAQAGG